MVDIGGRIRERRQRLGWSVQKLAILAEIDRGFLSKLETGKSAGSWETYGKLCGALGISMERLLVTQSNVEEAHIGWRKIPVLDYVQAGSWMSVNGLPQDAENAEYILTDLEHPSGTFALRIRGDSMEPEFHEGDVVVIVKTLSPKPGDYVVATDTEGEAVFKRYADRGLNDRGLEVFELVSLNPLYPAMRSDRQELHIVGVMVEKRSYRKR